MSNAHSTNATNVVLVHGGFVDDSGWEGVYKILRKDGYEVSIVQNPTISLADDVAATKLIIDAQNGPVILVGHSYGGAVITEAGNNPKVVGLVYIAAFAPDRGESVSTLIQDPPPGAPVPPILPPRDGYLFLDKAKFPASFAADVDAERAAFMADSQVPWGVGALSGSISEPAWKSKPSWYLVATDDKMIPPPAQRFMSERAGATVVEVAASHAIYVSQPNAVASLITQAAKDWRSTARHDDAGRAADACLKDIPFYLEVAKSVRGCVLEVGCGTGRVLLAAARAGVQVDGLDFSPVISILKGKLFQEPAEVRDRVTLHQGDMRNFSLGKTYDLITVPFRPLQYLLTVDDQLAAFRCFNAHLKIGGTLAFDVLYPDFHLLERFSVENVELDVEAEWTDPQDSSITVRRSYLRKSFDKLNQFIEGEFIFRSYRGEQLIQEERSKLNMSYYTYPHVLLLLKDAGFKVKEEYGSYDKEPISICKEMIFIAEKG